MLYVQLEYSWSTGDNVDTNKSCNLHLQCVQDQIIGKSLNPSKLPYLDHYGLVEIKKFALEIMIFEIPLIQV